MKVGLEDCAAQRALKWDWARLLSVVEVRGFACEEQGARKSGYGESMKAVMVARDSSGLKVTEVMPM